MAVNLYLSIFYKIKLRKCNKIRENGTNINLVDSYHTHNKRTGATFCMFYKVRYKLNINDGIMKCDALFKKRKGWMISSSSVNF